VKQRGNLGTDMLAVCLTGQLIFGTCGGEREDRLLPSDWEMRGFPRKTESLRYR
jgi:hypothetical protein